MLLMLSVFFFLITTGLSGLGVGMCHMSRFGVSVFSPASNGAVVKRRQKSSKYGGKSQLRGMLVWFDFLFEIWYPMLKFRHLSWMSNLLLVTKSKSHKKVAKMRYRTIIYRTNAEIAFLPPFYSWLISALFRSSTTAGYAYVLPMSTQTRQALISIVPAHIREVVRLESWPRSIWNDLWYILVR